MENIVKTKYQGNDQWWYLQLNCDRFMYLRHMLGASKIDTYRFDRFVGELESIGKTATIIALPLIDHSASTDFITNYRGHSDDKNPFVYRKKKLPIVKVDLNFDYLGNKHSYARGYYRTEPLTPGQQSYIKSCFSEQLLEFLSEELIESMKKEALKFAVNNLNIQISDMEKELKEFREYIARYKIVKKL